VQLLFQEVLGNIQNRRWCNTVDSWLCWHACL